MDQDEKINRRELLNSSALAGLALAFGFLGINNSVRGQTNQSGKSELMGMPASKKFIEEKIPQRKYKQIDFQPLLEKISTENMEIFEVESVLLNKAKSYIPIPAIDTDLDLDLEIAEVVQFNPNNIEDLLDQASNLLDRGIRDRAEWDNLSIRSFYLEQEINQFIELDKIHREETMKGYYDQLLNEKLSQLNIERLNGKMLEEISSVFSDMFEKMWNDQKVQTIIGDKQHLAISGIWASGPSGPTTQAITMADIASVNIEQFNMAIEKVYNYVQNNSFLKWEDQSKLKEKLLKKQVDWEAADRDFRLMRTDLDRKYEYLKLLAFKSEDGVLNLKKRIDPLKNRFTNDFNEACVRLHAANSGLEILFGYPENKRLPEYKKQVDYFDRCISWTREAVNWLISTSQMDQSFVITVSLQKLLKTKNIVTLNDALIQGRLKFDLDEDTFFKGYSNVRLKGTSMFIAISEKKRSKTNGNVNSYQGIIQCEIGIPANTYYRYSNGHTKDFDQSYIPIVKLNRIAARDFIRQPDIVGTSLFNNLSPFGEWNLFFPQIIADNMLDKVNVNDIHLDLFITARRLKSNKSKVN